MPASVSVPTKKSTSYLNINETFVADGGISLLDFRENIKVSSLAASSNRLAAEKNAKQNFSYSQFKIGRETRKNAHFSVCI